MPALDRVTAVQDDGFRFKPWKVTVPSDSSNTGDSKFVLSSTSPIVNN